MERSKTFLKNTPPLPPDWGGASVPRTRRGKNPRRIFDQFWNWAKIESGRFWAKQSFDQNSRAGAFGQISEKWQTHAKYFLGGAQNTHRLFKGGFRKRAGLWKNFFWKMPPPPKAKVIHRLFTGYSQVIHRLFTGKTYTAQGVIKKTPKKPPPYYYCLYS